MRKRLDVFIDNAPLLLLFLAYPLTLTGFVTGGDLPYHMPFPATFCWSLWCFTGLVLICFKYLDSPRTTFTIPSESTYPKRMRKYYIAPLLVGFAIVWILLSCLIHPYTPMRAGFFTLGGFAIPVFYAFVPPKRLPRLLPIMVSLLWLLNIAQGFYQFQLGNQVVGTTGNRNWYASLLLTSLPWLWVFLQYLFPLKQAKTRDKKHGWFLVAILIILATALPTGFLLYHAESRGAILALIIYTCLFGIFYRLRASLKVGALVIAIAALTFFCLHQQDRLQAIVEKDVRIPLWRGTASMIANHPVFGVGPGNFGNTFGDYRLSAQRERRKAQPITEHAHNQIMHVAATAGIPLAILWFLLIIPLAFPVKKGYLFHKCAHFSAFILVFHSMLDKTLHQPPDNLLAFICLGIVWRPFLQRLHLRPLHPVRKIDKQLSVLIAILVCSAAAYAGNIIVRSTLSAYHFRKGLVKNIPSPTEAYRHYKISYQLDKTNLRAGIFAANRAQHLNKPKLALAMFEDVYPRGSSFGHINMDVARTFIKLNEYEKAYHYFGLEAKYFPYSVQAWRNYYRLKIEAQQLDNLAQPRLRLAENRARHVRLEYEQKINIKTIAEKLVEALIDERFTSALKTSSALLNPLPNNSNTDPVLRVILKDIPNLPSTIHTGKEIILPDLKYMRHRLICQAEKEAILNGKQILKAQSLNNISRLKQLPNTQKAIRFYQWLYQLHCAGFKSTYLATPQDPAPQALVILDKEENLYAFEAVNYNLTPIKSEKLKQLTASKGQQLEWRIPCPTQPFLWRNQSFMDIVGTITNTKTDALPRGYSPMLDFMFTQRVLGNITNSQLAMRFDPLMILLTAPLKAPEQSNSTESKSSPNNDNTKNEQTPHKSLP